MKGIDEIYNDMDYIYNPNNELIKDKTVIVIAHRLSTIKNSDKIYLIDKGRVMESGSHEELILNECSYYSLVNEQKQELVLV